METVSNPYARAHVRRAIAREARRQERWVELRERARRMAEHLHSRYGEDLPVVLFGTLCDKDRFRLESDIDLAVEGLDPGQYWRAWEDLEPMAGDAGLDLVSLETAPHLLRKRILEDGEELT